MIAVLAVGCTDRSDDAQAARSGAAATAPATGDDPIDIAIEMADIAFRPASIRVAAGDTVRLTFTNAGAIAHDAFIGDPAAQAEHEAEMSEAADHHHGDSEDALTVLPGESGQLIHTFEQPGTIEIGCHQPGHYAAGMRIVVDVE